MMEKAKIHIFPMENTDRKYLERGQVPKRGRIPQTNRTPETTSMGLETRRSPGMETSDKLRTMKI